MNEKMKLGNWLALLGLSFATFIFNTSEFVPIGGCEFRDEHRSFHCSKCRVPIIFY